MQQRRHWRLKGATLASVVFLACGGSGTPNGSLSFSIAEGLLVLVDTDPTLGEVVLASGTGNCPYLQQNYSPDQIGNTGFLYFPLTLVNTYAQPQPLTTGTYNVIDPSMGYDGGAGFYTLALVLQTDSACNYTGVAGTGGSVTVSPFNVDGGTSDVSYNIIVSGNRVTGAYPLISCVLSAGLSPPDAGCIIPGLGPT